MKANQPKSKTKAATKNDDRLAGMDEFKKLQQEKAAAGHCMFC